MKVYLLEVGDSNQVYTNVEGAFSTYSNAVKAGEDAKADKPTVGLTYIITHLEVK